MSCFGLFSFFRSVVDCSTILQCLFTPHVVPGTWSGTDVFTYIMSLIYSIFSEDVSKCKKKKKEEIFLPDSRFVKMPYTATSTTCLCFAFSSLAPPPPHTTPLVCSLIVFTCSVLALDFFLITYTLHVVAKSC